MKAAHNQEGEGWGGGVGSRLGKKSACKRLR